MITNYKKYSNEYKNILEITYLFTILEAMELLGMLNMYNRAEDTYDIRKIFWGFLAASMMFGFMFLIGFTGLLYIINFFMR